MTAVGRNDPCPCGSGRKYKQCCLSRGPAAAAGADALNRDAIALQQHGRLDEAIAAYRGALASAPGRADLHFNLGTALQARGRTDDAVAAYRRAVALAPRLAVAHGNLGNALASLGRADEAAAAYRAALAVRADFDEARYNLGVLLHSRGDLAGAIACYDGVVARQADHADAHYNRGNALRDSGDIGAAVEAYRRALAARPHFAAALVNLAGILQSAGRVDDAIECLEKAVAAAPEAAAGWNNLGNARLEAGLPDAALAAYRRALAVDDGPELRGNFARALRHAAPGSIDAGLRTLLTRAIVEASARPADLAPIALRVLDPAAACREPPDPLLAAVLENAAACDARFEGPLAAARARLIDEAEAAMAAPASHADAGELAVALACQCHLNEYVWACSADEAARVSALRARIVAALDRDAPIPAAWLAAAAAYAPLSALPGADRLLVRPAGPRMTRLLAQQVAEARDVAREHAAIPVASPIADLVSQAVQQQYEEHPYPRWIRPGAVVATPSLNAYLRAQFPRAHFVPLADGASFRLLIAGCGTGQEAVETARQFPRAHVLAVDLSRASLAYARQKSRALGLANIDYAQADLLTLASDGDGYDAISSVGVLHHLADPEAGLHALVALLRPGGLMRLGFYSERARADVVAARAEIAAWGLAPTPDGIRRARAAFLAEPERCRAILSRRDFYTMSECRDLLFHVQERRLTLPRLAALLERAGLRFLGFLLEPPVLRRYARRFPDDPAGTDLARWAAFEDEHPDTFAGMYRFWAQRDANRG